MENKLGNYFTKGLQAGVLATALIAGNVSCSQPAGGNTYVPDGGYNGGNGDQTGGNEQGGTIGGGTGTGGNENPDPGKDPEEEENKYPDYYIDEEFGGQQFVEKDNSPTSPWYTESYSNVEFSKRYQNAKDFINEKVAELKTEIAGQSTNPYFETINKVLSTYNSKTTIQDNITTNYKAVAPFFAILENPYIQANDEKNYNKLKASYHKLAQYAYNNSLGVYYNVPDIQTNMEMRNLPENYFPDEVKLAGYDDFNAFTVEVAKDNMNTYLNSMANRTNINSNVLKKIVELALYNESLYGLNDMKRKLARVDLTRQGRTFYEFDGYIDDARDIDNGFTM